MRKTFGMNKHQKAVHKVGERHTSSEEIAELLEMSCSLDPEDRLTAAEHLCPCHVRKRIETVWEALFRMMEDPDRRVRQAAWHTLEDGGRPNDPATLTHLERILSRESDPKVQRFANGIIGGALRQKREHEMALLHLMPRLAVNKRRGKCDFCGESSVPVDYDPETPITTASGSRSALICEQCAKTLPQ